MTDVFTKSKRSDVMSRIRAKNNHSTELRLIEIMRSEHIHGWRRNQPIFGRPDFVFSSIKLAVFVDGCFWHRCPKCYKQPSNNADFWRSKIEANQKRDKRVNNELRKDGWIVLRIWEHELQDGSKVARKILKHF